jgi:predicted HTH transcriptional regulator
MCHGRALTLCPARLLLLKDELNAKGNREWAWFESLVNACVHRSYSFSGTEITIKVFPDRMEIESPGGFVPPVNEKTIGFTRSSRNHHLMDALRYLGYVRMAREGVRRIRESMSQSPEPTPIAFSIPHSRLTASAAWLSFFR